MFKTVSAKLANMRKSQEFVVQRDSDGVYLVQSDKSIGQFDGKGRGILCTKGSYFMYLMASMGAKAYLFPGDFVEEVQEIFIRPGETMGPGIIYGGLSTVGAKDVDPFKALKDYLRFENHFLSHDKTLPQKGELIWDGSLQAYASYTDQNLEIGIYKRRSAADFEAFVAEQIAKEMEQING